MVCQHVFMLPRAHSSEMALNHAMSDDPDWFRSNHAHHGSRSQRSFSSSSCRNGIISAVRELRDRGPADDIEAKFFKNEELTHAHTFPFYLDPTRPSRTPQPRPSAADSCRTSPAKIPSQANRIFGKRTTIAASSERPSGKSWWLAMACRKSCRTEFSRF